MKKIFVAIFTIFCCLLFAGCASVDYSRVVYGDGSMKDVYTITVQNINAPSARKIYLQMTADLESYIANEKAYYIQTVREYFDGEEETKYVNGYDFFIQQDKNGDEYTTTVTRAYLSLDVYDVYLQVMSGTLGGSEDEGESTGNGYVLEDGFFFKQYATYSVNWFYSLMQDETVRAAFENAMQDTEYNIANFSSYLDISQTYVCPTNSKLHANCDSTDEYLGYTLYEWDLTDKYDEGEGFQLKFYYNIPNATNWYILSMAIAVVVAFGLSIAMFVYVLVKHTKLMAIETKEKQEYKKRTEIDKDDGLE